MPSLPASAAPLPSWMVRPRSGRCRTVWPWKPPTAPSLGGMPLAARNASTASACMSVTSSSASASIAGRPLRSVRVAGTAIARRPAAAVGEIGGNRDRAPHDLAFRVAVGAVAGGTEAADLLAVGLDERHVHPIVGGDAHQPYRSG